MADGGRGFQVHEVGDEREDEGGIDDRRELEEAAQVITRQSDRKRQPAVLTASALGK
jgi:hypothetical protein